MIQFFASGEPKAQPRPRAFARKMGATWQARVYDAGTAEGWKSLVAAAAKPFLPTSPMTGPVFVELDFFMPRPKTHYRTGKHAGKLRDDAPQFHTGKPDRDNLEKAVCDALTQIGMWKDDGQVCDGPIRKLYGDRPGCHVTIKPCEEAATVCRTCKGRGEIELPPTYPPRSRGDYLTHCDTCGGTGRVSQ